MEVSRKSKWFQHVVTKRKDFFDIGFTAVYIDSDKKLVIMFWKCIADGEGPWLSSPNQ